MSGAVTRVIEAPPVAAGRRRVPTASRRPPPTRRSPLGPAATPVIRGRSARSSSGWSTRASSQSSSPTPPSPTPHVRRARVAMDHRRGPGQRTPRPPARGHRVGRHHGQVDVAAAILDEQVGRRPEPRPLQPARRERAQPAQLRPPPPASRTRSAPGPAASAARPLRSHAAGRPQWAQPAAPGNPCRTGTPADPVPTPATTAAWRARPGAPGRAAARAPRCDVRRAAGRPSPDPRLQVHRRNVRIRSITRSASASARSGNSGSDSSSA